MVNPQSLEVSNIILITNILLMCIYIYYTTTVYTNNIVEVIPNSYYSYFLLSSGICCSRWHKSDVVQLPAAMCQPLEAVDSGRNGSYFFSNLGPYKVGPWIAKLVHDYNN